LHTTVSVGGFFESEAHTH